MVETDFRMDFDESEAAEESVAESRPRAMISVLPSAATLGNLLCGFVAIYYCLRQIRVTYSMIPGLNPDSRWIEFFPTYVAVGAYLIVAAMIFDALDGQLARMTRKTSEFGAQLDSLSDVVSFGLAPAMLALTILIPLVLPPTGDALVSKMQWRLTLVGSLTYVACAAIRLARYNAENVKDESGQRRFSGLPVPGAAAALVSLLVLHETLRHYDPTPLTLAWAGAIRWMLGPTIFVLGLLMVSRVDYPHLFNVYFRKKHPPTHLVFLVVLVGCWWFFREAFLVVLTCGYIISGPVLTWFRRRGESLPSRLGVRQPQAGRN